MRRLKLCSAILTSALALNAVPAIGLAATEDVLDVKVNYETKTIDISYESPLRYDSYVTFYIAEASDAAVFTDFENVDRISQQLCERGVITKFSIPFADDMAGAYDVFVAPSGTAAEEEYYKLPTPITVKNSTEVKNILDLINAATADQIDNVIYDNLKVDLELPEASCPEWKGEYLYQIKVEDEVGGKYTSLASVDAAWDTADYIYQLRSKATSAQLAQIDADNVLGLNTANADYQAYKSAVGARLTEQLTAKNARSKATVTSVFNEALALAAINNRNTEGKANALTEYASQYSITAELAAQISSIGAGTITRYMTDYTATNAADVAEKVRLVIASLGDIPSVPSSPGGPSPTKRPSTPSFTTGNVSTPTGGEEAKTMFTDVKDGYWAKNAIEKLAEAGVINGFDDGTFRGDDLVTREQFVTMIVKAFGVNEASEDQPFGDIPENFWGAMYINSAYAAGIVNGVSDDAFGIGYSITRQDAAKIIYNSMLYGKIPVGSGKTTTFTDKGAIADYAAEAITKLSDAGIINGYDDGTFRPRNTITRAEAATIIYRAVESFL